MRTDEFPAKPSAACDARAKVSWTGSSASLNAVSSWPFADAVFSWNYDFFEYVDTESMFLDLFDRLRQDRIIP